MSGEQSCNFDLSRALAEQSQKARWFETTFQTRFADYVHGGKLHCAKCFEFFEMARFDLLSRFKLILDESSAEHMMEYFFLVAKVDYERIQEPLRSGYIKIRTRLLVQSSPVLEFTQELLDPVTGEVSIKATVKVAMVDQNMRMVTHWQGTILQQILEFVTAKEERED